MAVVATTLETYDSRTLREDLMEAENILDVWETPFISMIAKKGKCTNVKHEWPRLALIGPVDNRQIEGDDAPTVTAPNTADRRSNYTQISTKVISVSDTSQWVDGAANIEKLSRQISYKLKELKMDKEKMLLANVPASPGAGAATSAAARQAAGLPCFLITNRSYGGTPSPLNPTISGSPTAADGYPLAAAGVGTNRAITESLFRTVMAMVWTSGGQPKYALTTAALKSKISETFSGTKYNADSVHVRHVDDASKKLTLATDVYESDFGTVQIVPDRHMMIATVLFIDPNYVSVDYGQDTSQKEIARTGLSEKRLISCEYTLTVGNEAAHGILTDVT